MIITVFRSILHMLWHAKIFQFLGLFFLLSLFQYQTTVICVNKPKC